MDSLINPAIRHYLAALANAIFPLDAWVQEVEKYLPPAHLTKPLPWRGEFDALSIESLKCLKFFEESLAEGEEESFIGRFQQIAANPLSLSALGDVGMKDWRRARKLPEVGVRFSPQESENIEFIAANQPIARRDFYERCFQQLQHVFELRQPVGVTAWEQIAKDLLNDENKSVTGWDTDIAQIKSSLFIKAFVREIIVILLNGKFDLERSDPRWNFAVAIELGEHRRPGNAYTIHDTRQSVQQLRAKLAEVSQRPPK